MRWEDERYVRVYTRDTGDWLMWPWETRALLLFIFRKVDRAGILHLGKGGLKALAAVVGMPLDVVTTAIEPLLEDGCVAITEGDLFVPNFAPAQEANSSDRARKEASRERSRDKLRARIGREPTSREVDLSVSHTPSQPVTLDVTAGHTESHAVTSGHSVPCRTVPNRAVPSEARAQESSEKQPESGFDLALRIWQQSWSGKYGRQYTLSPDTSLRSEHRVLQRVGALALAEADPEAYLAHKYGSYLRDKGDKSYLIDHSHPLRCVERDWNDYGLPPAKKAPEKKPPESSTRLKSEPPAKLADNAAQGKELLSKLLGKVG